MKNFLISFALVSLVFVGCSKDDTPDELPQQNPIGFGTFAHSMTKSAVAMHDNIVLFAVNQDLPTANWFFYNQLLTFVSVNGLNGAYSYTPVKYWPISQTKGINFYAYAPKETTTALGWPASSAVDTTGTITYTVPVKADEDFKMAKLLNVVQTVGNDPVVLSFEHMLSKVTLGTFEFQNVLPGMSASLSKVELIGLANVGTRPFNALPTAAWSSTSGTAGTYSRTTPFDPFYIMPQTFDNLDSLAFSITLNDGTGNQIKRVSVALSDVTKGSWQSAVNGRNYILNLELDANDVFKVIKFEANVNDWTPENVAMPVVQPTAQKLNSMVNGDVLVIGGTTSTNKFRITGTIAWNWSDPATYAFNGLRPGMKFSMTFSGLIFDPSSKITISVPTTFKVYKGTTSLDTQTIDVTAATDVIYIEQK